MTDVISGIKMPDSKIACEAAELVRQHKSELLFNHSVRVFVCAPNVLDEILDAMAAARHRGCLGRDRAAHNAGYS
jgi:hypothetical protein